MMQLTFRAFQVRGDSRCKSAARSSSSLRTPPRWYRPRSDLERSRRRVLRLRRSDSQFSGTLEQTVGASQSLALNVACARSRASRSSGRFPTCYGATLSWLLCLARRCMFGVDSGLRLGGGRFVHIGLLVGRDAFLQLPHVGYGSLQRHRLLGELRLLLFANCHFRIQLGLLVRYLCSRRSCCFRCSTRSRASARNSSRIRSILDRSWRELSAGLR